MAENKPAQNNNASWMIVYVTHDLSEAHIVAGRLKSEGMMAIVDHMAGRSAIGISIGNWGEVRVLVHPNDYELAESILFPDLPDELEEQTDDIIYYWQEDDLDDDNDE